MRSDKYAKLSAIMKKMERQENKLLNKIERREHALCFNCNKIMNKLKYPNQIYGGICSECWKKITDEIVGYTN